MLKQWVKSGVIIREILTNKEGSNRTQKSLEKEQEEAQEVADLTSKEVTTIVEGIRETEKAVDIKETGKVAVATKAIEKVEDIKVIEKEVAIKAIEKVEEIITAEDLEVSEVVMTEVAEVVIVDLRIAGIIIEREVIETSRKGIDYH